MKCYSLSSYAAVKDVLSQRPSCMHDVPLVNVDRA